VPGPGKERRCTKRIDPGDLARIDGDLSFLGSEAAEGGVRVLQGRGNPQAVRARTTAKSARDGLRPRSQPGMLPASQQSAESTQLDRPPRVTQFHVKHCQRTATCVSGSGWHRAASIAPDPPPPRRKMQRFDGAYGSRSLVSRPVTVTMILGQCIDRMRLNQVTLRLSRSPAQSRGW
jgi:hypothetical protein